MNVTSQQLQAIATINTPVTQKRFDSVLPLINAALDKYKINTPMRICHFLAQLFHESVELSATHEFASGDEYDTRTDLGNTPEVDGDGRLYKGRGFIQLTGKANYELYGKAIGVDLIANPDLVATKYPADAAGWFWNNHNLNALADTDSLTRITEIINGGHNGLQSRLNYLGRAKRAIMIPHV